jgi:hypothetical protein
MSSSSGILLVMMERLQRLSTPLTILTFAAVAAVLLALSVGVGMLAALTLGSDEGSPGGAKPEQVEVTNRGQAGGPDQGTETVAADVEYTEEGGSGASNGAAYSGHVARIQRRAVEASLRSNEKLLRYDGLTAADIEEMETDSAALERYARRAEDLVPPTEYEGQYTAFVRALGELRDAGGLAYRLAADPSSATQERFEAHDRHVDRATFHLNRSNELLEKNYRTTRAAQEVSLG